MTDMAEMTITALNALASSPDGTMTLPDLSSLLETRLGSTDETAESAASFESRQFQRNVQALLTELEGQGYATRDSTGGQIQITPERRAFVGR